MADSLASVLTTELVSWLSHTPLHLLYLPHHCSEESGMASPRSPFRLPFSFVWSPMAFNILLKKDDDGYCELS